MTEQVAERDTRFFTDWLRAAAEAVAAEEDRLTELDSAIGDADHGSNMRRGFTAVVAALDADPPGSPREVLLLAGRTLVATVGGASGPLFGILLRAAGQALGEAERVTDQELRTALSAGVAAVGRLGGAAAGDKTMLDALLPATAALPDYAAADRAARDGAAGTVPLRAHKGRASYLGERSVGHEDPGAASAALLVGALTRVSR
ncbi:dihydroxyacetone kinase subunit DhaL [Streptomyces sp. DSM 44915]|uniref:Dihydroxyacetone kinase subunit DhaL n=1 Tax=Streptomyces chisholmiae TaxID=3075540 RepID=A0ABU2JV67_9ACTN|nr:dihydroxyacetone kinase subunit DhaL [Streptomyces sp. DSM 44915]MDT0268792.1 dihydroxyacetone kinase subunit DhaL [Streptomyces sp. DSM 44915]